MHFLGIDASTTATKALLMDATGLVMAGGGDPALRQEAKRLEALDQWLHTP